MIDTMLALVPTYGVWLVLASVALSCLAVPLPSSMLVMAAGGFAAAGDIEYWQLVLFAFIGFVAGDQAAYALARRGGAPALARMAQRPKSAAVLASAQRLVDRRGVLAVVLSRTVLSPIGPYVAYLSGALGLDWLRFSAAAIVGAALWSLGYSWLGYAFASQIADIAALIGQSVGLVVAAAVILGIGYRVLQSYRAEMASG